jgi:uroporphyrinogen decarboxylase
MMAFLKEDPKKMHQVLEVITETYVDFAKESLNTGAWGLFYATTRWATYNRMTDEEYAEFGRPYDLKLLEAFANADFNVMHVCQSKSMLRTLADYPVHAFNWDTQDPSNVWLKEGREITCKAVIGGVGRGTTLVHGTPDQVAAEVKKARTEMGNQGWMVGPGCTFPPEAPEENLKAIREAVSAA